jgi:hypothetical protein
LEGHGFSRAANNRIPASSALPKAGVKRSETTELPSSLRHNILPTSRLMRTNRHSVSALAMMRQRRIPTLGEGAEGGTERAERSGGLHKRSAEDWGYPLRRAIGAEPLSEACLPYSARSAQPLGGRCGKERPAEEGGGRRSSVWRQGGVKLIPANEKGPGESGSVCNAYSRGEMLMMVSTKAATGLTAGP